MAPTAAEPGAVPEPSGTIPFNLTQWDPSQADSSGGDPGMFAEAAPASCLPGLQWLLVAWCCHRSPSLQAPSARVFS